MKISFVVTVLNEEKAIGSFIDSLLKQAKMPDEIVIVDGGSSDQTVTNIKNQISKIKNENIAVKIIIKKGNRSVGRNQGIKNSYGDIILSSDAGCILDKNWVKNITKPFEDEKVDVVAGYYKGQAKNIFQKSLVPYVLVMPDKVNPKEFLPATRSMALRKTIWKKIGGFDERLSHNEDFAFANKLKKIGAKIVFVKDAIVNWMPRKNLIQAFTMFFRFAIGDAEAGIFRSKVLLIFVRYLLAVYLFLLSYIERSSLLFYGLVFSLFLYVLWSIGKNYKYVKDLKALFFLPLFQIFSDFAVLLGTTIGFFKGISFKKFGQVIINNKGVSLIIGAYVVLMILLINWGIPNKNHPFNYFMDEWHQAQAVRAVFTHGSPNVEGAANGSMFHFLLSGLYLVPFVVLGFVNPFAIYSSVSSSDIQHSLFQILRLNTLLFGVFSIILIAHVAKKYLRLNPFLTTLLFVVNPIWLSLSNYFKYDIALVFWITLGLIFLLKFVYNPTVRNYLIAGGVCAISFAVKLSAIALLPVYVIVFLLYFPYPLKNISKLVIGILVYIGFFILFGIPDLIFGRGDIYEYLDSNLRRTPVTTSNYDLGMHYIPFLIFKLYPSTFGHILYFSFLSASLLFLIWLIKSISHKKLYVLKRTVLKDKAQTLLAIAFTFFLISLIPLKIEARSNRLLVLLPFIALFTSFFLIKTYRIVKNSKQKILFVGVLSLLTLFQLYESFGWIWIKVNVDPRVSSSVWLQQNVKEGEKIGIENIPIYQMLPDIVVEEYYSEKYGLKVKNKFTYEIIDGKSSQLPKVIILTNGEVESQYLRKSSKKDLVSRLKKEKYKVVASFSPNFRYYRLYGDEFTFYIASLVISPNKITIFSKM